MSIEQLRHRFAAYLKTTYSPPGRRSRILIGAALAGLGAFILLLDVLLGMWQAAPLGVILLASGGFRLYLVLSPQRVYRRIRGVVERGEPVVAYVVQANEHLFVPGTQNLPSLVIFSFDPRGEDAAFMSAVAETLHKLKGTKPAEPELRPIAERITSEKAEIYHREQVPPSITEGVPVYMGDLYIWRLRLREKYLDRGTLFCLAEAGDQGGIELVPDWLVEEARRSQPAEPANKRRSSLRSAS